MTTKHTPGPWTIEEYGDRDYPNLVLHADSETRVCFMATPGSKGDPARIAADARLIAAAPDLLKAMLENYGPPHLVGNIGYPAAHPITLARAALTKAGAA